MPADFLARLDESAGAERWRDFIRKTPESALVCERDSEVAGVCQFGPSRDDDAPEDRGEIYSLNVLPDRWRSGIGRELMAASLDQLSGRSLASPTLWVVSSNDRARRFYEALGFAPDGVTKIDSDLTGVSLAETRYVLSSVLSA